MWSQELKEAAMELANLAHSEDQIQFIENEITLKDEQKVALLSAFVFKFQTRSPKHSKFWE